MGTSDLHSALGRSSGDMSAAAIGWEIHALSDLWQVDGGQSLRSRSQRIGPASGVGREATALNGALNSILSTKRVQSTVSAGLRWDFLKNADLKMQVDHTRIGAGSSDELINLQPGYRPGGS